MNLILAQIKKDLLCQRALFITWVICIIVPLLSIAIASAFGHVAPAHLDNGNVLIGMVSIGLLATAGVAIPLVGLLFLTPFLVILVVQEDPLMGTTAFWRTRPIPREKLLAAKTLLIVLLPIPVLLTRSANSDSLSDHTWPSELAWIAAIAAVAAITPNLKQFLFYALALAVGRGLFTSLVESLWSRYHGDGSVFSYDVLQQFTAIGRILHINGSDFFQLCYFVGFTAVFVHQYLTLQTRRSLGILIATIVIVCVLRLLVGPLGYPSALH